MASSIGGYDYDFINDVPEDLVCALCHFAFKNPVQIEECGHIYCKDCYQQMKEHAENSGAELLCPLDREKIDVARVFKDKAGERRVLNLMVKCQNFGDKCDWTGELRDVLDHERNCCKNDTMYEQLVDRLTKIESIVKSHEQKHDEKDNQIKIQNKLIESFNKQFENLNNKIEDQSMKITDLKKQILNLDSCNENQEKQMVDNKKQIEDLKQCLTKHQSSLPLSMIIPNIEDESCYSPICTAFQWKFKPSELKSGIVKCSPPFYNIMNTHCFQLQVGFENNNFRIILYRLRGKFDHNVNEIKGLKNTDFHMHIFGKYGTLKIVEWGQGQENYSISKHQMTSQGWGHEFENSEINISSTVDGYVHLHCFFSDISQC